MSYFLSRCLSLLTVTFIFRGPLLTSAVKGKIFHGTSEIFKHYHNIHGHLQNTRIYFNRLVISNQNSKRFFKSERKLLSLHHLRHCGVGWRLQYWNQGKKDIVFFFSQQSFSCNILHIQASTAPRLPNTCCVEMD